MEKTNMVATIEQVNSLVINEPAKAVQVIDESVKGLKTFDDKVAFIGQSAMFGRAQWVQTSIVVARAFEGLSKKEIGAKVDTLKAKLNYGRSHVYNLKKAGDKLLAESKAGTLKSVPFTLTEYIAPEKREPINKQAIKNCVKAGEYTTADNEKFLIYRGLLLTSDKKESVCYFTVPAGGLIKDGATIDIASEAKLTKDGKTTDKEKEVFSISGKFYDVKLINL